ncbi:P-loop containing nucleoside triphosphate hydrolases superfamily protein isoform X2 [Wolffia australiana]
MQWAHGPKQSAYLKPSPSVCPSYLLPSSFAVYRHCRISIDLSSISSPSVIVMEQPWRCPPRPASGLPAAPSPQFPFHGGGGPPNFFSPRPPEPPPLFRPVPGNILPVDPFLPRLQPSMGSINPGSWHGPSAPAREQHWEQIPSKRMKFGDDFLVNSGIHHLSQSYPARIVAEDERRLNLIRNHGRTQLNLSFGVEQMNSFVPERPSWSGDGQDLRIPVTNYALGGSSHGMNQNSNPRYSDRVLDSEFDRVSSSYAHSSVQSVDNSRQCEVHSPSNAAHGSWGRIDHRQEADYPQRNIRYNRENEKLDVHGFPGNGCDPQFYSRENTQHFERRPAHYSGNFNPLEIGDHHLQNPSAPVQYQVNINQSSQNLPPQPHQQRLQSHPSIPFQSPMSLHIHSSSAHSAGVSRAQTSRGLSDGIAGSNPYHANGRSEISMKGVLPPQVLSQKHPLGSEALPRDSLKDKRLVIDATHIFCKPHRTSRPEHIVLILRGLPGSGKSYLAKALRDLEVENGGSAPRIHCIDDYFMAEVETAGENDVSMPGSVKGKKQAMTKLEYCYEPEMEEAYRSSMLKAFKKTVDDKTFSFAIVDDRNLRVADFAQFWAIGKRSGYEVYLVEAPYKDPAGCAARNIHGFTLEDVKRMSERWEEAPPFYLQLDIETLFRGDDLDGSNIEEVDMDMEDTHEARVKPERCDDDQKVPLDEHRDSEEESSVGTKERWVDELDAVAEPRELGKSKWSTDLEEDVHEKKAIQGGPRLDSFSGLIQAYSKHAKSVMWADQAEKKGFSIGASRNKSACTLVIGPGAGYNLESNPHKPEDSADEMERSGVNMKRNKSLFLDHTRAEHESFRAVFDRRRRQRIGGLDGPVDD